MMTFVSCGPINRLISFPRKTKAPFSLGTCKKAEGRARGIHGAQNSRVAKATTRGNKERRQRELDRNPSDRTFFGESSVVG